MDTRSSEPWSHRRVPTLTATFPVVINSDEEGHSDIRCLRLHASHKPVSRKYEDSRFDCFLQTESLADQAVFKQVRALQKKLQQTEMLEGKQSNGQLLDDQQIAKLQTKSTLENALVELGFPPETESRLSYPVLSDGKGNKKADLSRKQRRKNKQRAAQSDVLSLNRELCEEQQLEKEFSDIKILQITEEKVSFQYIYFFVWIIS